MLFPGTCSKCISPFAVSSWTLIVRVVRAAMVERRSFQGLVIHATGWVSCGPVGRQPAAGFCILRMILHATARPGLQVVQVQPKLIQL